MKPSNAIFQTALMAGLLQCVTLTTEAKVHSANSDRANPGTGAPNSDASDSLRMNVRIIYPAVFLSAFSQTKASNKLQIDSATQVDQLLHWNTLIESMQTTRPKIADTRQLLPYYRSRPRNYGRPTQKRPDRLSRHGWTHHIPSLELAAN